MNFADCTRIVFTAAFAAGLSEQHLAGLFTVPASTVQMWRHDRLDGAARAQIHHKVVTYIQELKSQKPETRNLSHLSRP